MDQYSNTIDYLYNKLPFYQRIGVPAYKKDLNNTWKLMELLDHPERSFKSIHVAGTNGKGSISILLSEILRSHGYKTGLYTSPHFKDFRERIRVNGHKIPQNAVIDFVDRHREQWQGIHPSFFEITVAMAFDYFKKEQIDIAVVEVGLGGRLDSTNVITPELCVISRIGFDHQVFLGDSIEEIAMEKAGIIKPQIPVVLGINTREVHQVITQIAESRNSEIEVIDKILESPFDIPDYQKENLTTVNVAIERLRKLGWELEHYKTQNAIASVFNEGKITGRWQVLENEPLTITEAAHNSDGIKSLVHEINKRSFDKLHVILGIVKDKDPASILNQLPKEATYYFCKAAIPRGLPAEDLKDHAWAVGLKGKAYKSVKNALNAAQEHANKSDLIIVTGSIFVIAEII